MAQRIVIGFGYENHVSGEVRNAFGLMIAAARADPLPIEKHATELHDAQGPARESRPRSEGIFGRS